jgi:hypothetical protein
MKNKIKPITSENWNPEETQESYERKIRNGDRQ